MRGQILQQPCQLRERFRRGQLVQIIDDQKSAVTLLSELRSHSVEDRPLVEAGCRGQLLAIGRRAVGLPDGAQDGHPELLGVLLLALHLDGRPPIRPAWPIRPGTQQRGLTAACGGRDKRYLGFGRAIKGSEKFSALNQPRSCLTRPSVICPDCHACTRLPGR